MPTLEDLVAQSLFTRDELIRLLSTTDPEQIEVIRRAAEAVLLAQVGSAVYFRGLIEFSNICSCDCLYCGIRQGNQSVKRYLLPPQTVVDTALWCASQGYGSVVLQSGERTDPNFIDYVCEVIQAIREKSKSADQPQGVGITLSCGEQSAQTYQRWFDAGAHRYLLRIETSSAALFAMMHPPHQTFANRVRCLQSLKSIGYQVGTGVMIGLPGQATAHLADDLMFFREMDVDMIGMGPFIVHNQTPMALWPQSADIDKEESMRLSLLMIALCRLTLKNVNIAATTALQALDPQGREEGLRFGANIIMPQVTPVEFRQDYQLYEGKPCLDESAQHCKNCLDARVRSAGRTVGYFEWGDSPHARQIKHD